MGRVPASSSSNSENSSASLLELTVFWLRGASCVSGPAPLNAEWCKAAVNSMRTVIRSCLSHERSRRSFLRRAEPLPLSTFILSPAEVGLERKPHKKRARLNQTPVVVVDTG